MTKRVSTLIWMELIARPMSLVKSHLRVCLICLVGEELTAGLFEMSQDLSS